MGISVASIHRSPENLKEIPLHIKNDKDEISAVAPCHEDTPDSPPCQSNTKNGRDDPSITSSQRSRQTSGSKDVREQLLEASNPKSSKSSSMIVVLVNHQYWEREKRRQRQRP